MESTAAISPAPPTSGSFIAKLGAWLQLAQLIGIAGTVAGMVRAFGSLKATGSDDPVHLSMAIGQVLLFTLVGFLLSLIGLVLVIVAVTACRYRARWMYYFLWCYGILALGMQMTLVLDNRMLGLTFHIPFGLFFIIFALVKRGEFLRACATEK